jgi:hypothetical protein
MDIDYTDMRPIHTDNIDVDELIKRFEVKDEQHK